MSFISSWSNGAEHTMTDCILGPSYRRYPIQERKRMKQKATKQIRKIPNGGNSDKQASLSESESETQEKLSEATTTMPSSSMHQQDLQTAAPCVILPQASSFKNKKKKKKKKKLKLVPLFKRKAK